MLIPVMIKRLTHLLLFFIPIVCSSQVRYDFETGNLTGWTQIPDAHWSASTSTPIAGIYSMKHTYNSTTDAIDRISVELPVWNPCSGTVIWQVKVRHGYDPSSANRWWVMLMSDQDANHMYPGGSCSGYAIGVNLTDSDDLLKLWRIDNGIPQLVIASSLNWQTQIGKTTTSIGAIEVERNAYGNFTLKASTTGSFTELANYGSSVDINHSVFSYFGICYGYTSSADMLLWVDDITFSYNPLNKNDITTEVIEPISQVNTGSIPSTSNNFSEAVDVMKFQIRDNSTLDNLPTRVKALTLKQVTSTNGANWLNTIGGVRLRGESGEVSILNQSISSDKISLEVDTTTITIPDGQTQEYTLSITLKPDNLVDGSSIKLMIDSVHHGFEAGLSGSDFSYTFPKKIISNEFNVSVDATQIKFLQAPSGVYRNTPFTISVAGADQAGNVDSNYTNQISAALFQGDGILSAPSSLLKIPSMGIATWNDLEYSALGTFKISTSSSGFSQIVTNEIKVLNDTTTSVNPPTSQPAGKAISSLNCYPANAVEVLRFSVFDPGTTDGIPTIVKNIKVSRVEQTDAASLSKSIAGILMRVNGIPLSISQPAIKTSDITFTVENLEIPDGEFKDISIYVYLKDQGLTDNQKIQLKIDAVNHGFIADTMGSAFRTVFPRPVISNVFWVNVVATQLKFTSTPSRVGVLKPFDIGLNSTDINGNTDKDFTGVANLSLLSGAGALSFPSGTADTIAYGSCTYSALTYSIPDQFSLLAACSTLNSVSSSRITCGDADGGISAVSNPPDSVYVNSASTNADDAVEVLRLNVYDGGSTDGLPLIPTKICLHPFDPTREEQLNRQIEGFVVKADNRIIEIESYSLNNDVFEINLREGNLLIADSDTVDLAVSIYLKKGEVVDNFPFQFYVPAASHGWKTSAEGTDFASSFNSVVYGPVCRLIVDGSNLKFIETPFTTFPSQQFPVKVCAADVNGSIDNDYSDLLTLSLDYGSGAFTCSDINQELSSGIAEWSDVTFDRIGTYRFKVSGENLEDSFSDEIYCGIDYSCLVQEDFESTMSQNWLGVNDWRLSTISPISGSKSLQHQQSESSGVSALSIPVGFPSVGDKLLEWNLTLRNGDWDPSSDNYFFFALMVDTSDLNFENSNGYFVGINPSAGNDFITLWRSYQGTKTGLITTSFDWNSSDEVKIRVGLTPKGEWKLWYMPKGAQAFFHGGEGKSLTNSQMNWSGPVFGYTSSRSGQLWMDDLSICVSDYPPVLQSAKPLNLNTVKVQFSEHINLNDASDRSNFSITDKDGSTININSTLTSTDLPNGVNLKTDRLPFGKLLLKVDAVSGLNGESIKDSIYFGLGESGTFGRLIINEIMANPEPSVGLPIYEYIELYNPTSDTILLDGWTMQMNSYSLKLPNDSILPKQYVVLCSTSAAPILSAYGKSIGVTSFPALLNAGMTLKLLDAGGSLIALVNYSDSWYGDDQKIDGGWSLEKIDYQNLMEGKNNWRTSISPNGGTPCAENSVAAINPDTSSPRVLSLEISSDSTILLQFSEPMDSLMLTYSYNYDIDNGIDHPANVTLQGGEYSSALLSLPESISTNIIYNLCLSLSITDFSGNTLVCDCLPFTLPQIPVWNDIVINEVLFNPNAGGADFVEIFNRSDKTFELSKMLLSNRSSTTNQLDQVYCVSDTAKLLFPDDYAVITVNPELVRRFYRTENDKAFIGVSKMASFNNDEGHVVLLSNDSTVIDELHYSESMHSKLLNDVKGVSLERINPELESSSASTWHSAAQTVGFATPTYKNSQWVETSVKEDAFTLSPKTFSPDGDGRDDYLLIAYKLPTDGCVANIKVFNAEGREIRRLASNLLVGTEGALTWDGLDGKNQRVPIGIYIVYIEYFNPNGDVNKIKKTCVVAEKL